MNRIDDRAERRKQQIPFNRPFIVGKELYYIAQSVLEMHLSGDGPYTARCSRWLEQQIGSPLALLTHSCTAALEMAAILCDVGPGDEVIMPSYTFPSTANAFVLRGATPVFVDIKRDTINIDEDRVEAAITPRTKVIAVVHYAGTACNMDTIMALAKKHGLLVVEDAAQALLATFKGRPLGSIGHFGCFSFHETKNVISGEGGALLVNEARHSQRAEIIREKGTNRKQFFRGEVDKYTWVDIGSSYLPSEIVSAFLYAQLENASHINATRQALCQAYYERLAPLEAEGKIELPHSLNPTENSGHLFYILTSVNERDRLLTHLSDHGIKALFHYVPLHSSPAGRRFGRVAGSMDHTNHVSDTLVRLPLYYGMTESDLQRVTDAITEFYRK